MPTMPGRHKACPYVAMAAWPHAVGVPLVGTQQSAWPTCRAGTRPAPTLRWRHGRVPGTHEGCPNTSLKAFKRVIDDETVPEDIPFAVPYDDLEKRKIKTSPKVKSIRGKLNVPRERFHLRGRTTYLWAGL